ncbi:DASS family sodium-coupled anion symporter [bacterium]|nr:DASS family sodium-coupled anion symporter [bacterium]
MISLRSFLIFVLIILISIATLFIPFRGMSVGAHRALAVFIFAIFCWVTEIIPIAATAGIIVSLLAYMLPPVTKGASYSDFLASFASPTVILFAGGYFLAAAMQKFHLDIVFARSILKRTGTSPRFVLAGIMLTTAFLSMWMSNTATTALMVAAILPLIQRIKGDPFAKALILGIPFSANVGGIGTPIGTPPNAIAIQALAGTGEAISFLKWVSWGIPIAVILTTFIWWLLQKLFPSQKDVIQVNLEPTKITWKHLLILITLIITALLWLTTSIHHIPSGMIALIPPIVFLSSGILNRDDLRAIGWDVLILMAGGIALGLGMKVSGLSIWFMEIFRFQSLSLTVLIIIFGIMALIMSNFISHTAATNILIPLGIALGTNIGAIAITTALMSSSAMALPVSTPPNAIAYSSGIIDSRDMRKAGIIVGLFAMVLNFLIVKYYIPFIIK